jgi:hypothetical protein
VIIMLVADGNDIGSRVLGKFKTNVARVRISDNRDGFAAKSK